MHENSIPIFQISLLAKHQVTVLLSGEGADEVYGGYVTQSSFRTVCALRRWFPPSLARRLEPLAWSLPRTRPARLLQRIGAASLAESMALSAGRGSERFLARLGWRLRKEWGHRIEIAETALRSTADPALAHMLFDQQTYVQTLLDRQDKMSMGASIESRVPFLDVPTVAAVNGMGIAVRHRDGDSKWVLRQIGKRYLPPEIVARRKHAFGLPLGPWMRGSKLIDSQIRGLAGGHLVKAGIMPRGIAQRISDAWSREGDTLATLVWTLVNLEVWWELFLEGRTPEGLDFLPSHASRGVAEQIPSIPSPA